jgi:hypothetical protein
MWAMTELLTSKIRQVQKVANVTTLCQFPRDELRTPSTKGPVRIVVLDD